MPKSSSKRASARSTGCAKEGGSAASIHERLPVCGKRNRLEAHRPAGCGRLDRAEDELESQQVVPAAGLRLASLADGRRELREHACPCGLGQLDERNAPSRRAAEAPGHSSLPRLSRLVE